MKKHKLSCYFLYINLATIYTYNFSAIIFKFHVLATLFIFHSIFLESFITKGTSKFFNIPKFLMNF